MQEGGGVIQYWFGDQKPCRLFWNRALWARPSAPNSRGGWPRSKPCRDAAGSNQKQRPDEREGYGPCGPDLHRIHAKVSVAVQCLGCHRFARL